MEIRYSKKTTTEGIIHNNIFKHVVGNYIIVDISAVVDCLTFLSVLP